MLGKLIDKEIKIYLKSIEFYLFFLVLMGLFLITFKPMSIGKNICPLDEMHFMYRIMINDYVNGVVENSILIEDANLIKLTASFKGDSNLLKESEEMIDRAKKTLTIDQNEYLGDFISKLQAGTILEDENIDLDIINNMQSEVLQQINFSVTYEEFIAFVNKFDGMLGGDTYYGENFRQRLCTELNYSSYFGAVAATEQEEIRQLYELIQEDIQMGQVTVETTEGAYFTVDLSDEAVDELEDFIDYLLNHREGEEFNLDIEEYHSQVSLLNQYLVGYYNNDTSGIKVSIETSIYPDGTTQVYRDANYEEAMQLYNDILTKDNYTNAFARLMADKMGLIVLMLVVFLAGYNLLNDKSYKMQEIIYSKQISSLTYIMAKYLSVIILITFCCLTLVVGVTIIFLKLGYQYHYQVDAFAFIKYFILWVFPTIMFGTAIGMFISFISDMGILAILVNFGFFILSVEPAVGNYSLSKAAIRFNVLGDYDKYSLWYNDIVRNRIFYVILSIIIILGLWIGFDYKRNRFSSSKLCKSLKFGILDTLRNQLDKYFNTKNLRIKFSDFSKIRFSSIGDNISYFLNSIWYNYKIACKLNTLLSVSFIAVIFLLFHYDMNITYLAEHFVSIIGVICFVSIENIEKRIGCSDIIGLRNGRFQTMLRRCMAIIISLVLTFIPLWIMGSENPVSMNKLALGTWITGAFLGSIGMLAARITGNIVAGYLVSFGYYVGAVFTNDSLFQPFCIFSISSNSSFTEKIYLITVVVIIFVVNGLWDIKSSH